MSVSALITDGLGSFGNIARVIMLGLHPGDAVDEVVSHRRYKKYGKGYLKRDGEILVFDSEELADEYVEAEIKALLLPNRKERRIAIAKRPKPVEVVEVAVIEKEASIVGMPVDVHTVDYENLIKLHHKMLQMQDDQDVEMLILAADNEAISEIKNLINFAMSRMKH